MPPRAPKVAIPRDGSQILQFWTRGIKAKVFGKPFWYDALRQTGPSAAAEITPRTSVPTVETIEEELYDKLVAKKPLFALEQDLPVYQIPYADGTNVKAPLAERWVAHQRNLMKELELSEEKAFDLCERRFRDDLRLLHEATRDMYQSSDTLSSAQYLNRLRWRRTQILRERAKKRAQGARPAMPGFFDGAEEGFGRFKWEQPWKPWLRYVRTVQDATMLERKTMDRLQDMYEQEDPSLMKRPVELDAPFGDLFGSAKERWAAHSTPAETAEEFWARGRIRSPSESGVFKDLLRLKYHARQFPLLSEEADATAGIGRVIEGAPKNSAIGQSLQEMMQASANVSIDRTYGTPEGADPTRIDGVARRAAAPRSLTDPGGALHARVHLTDLMAIGFADLNLFRRAALLAAGTNNADPAATDQLTSALANAAARMPLLLSSACRNRKHFEALQSVMSPDLLGGKLDFQMFLSRMRDFLSASTPAPEELLVDPDAEEYPQRQFAYRPPMMTALVEELLTPAARLTLWKFRAGLQVQLEALRMMEEMYEQFVKDRRQFVRQLKEAGNVSRWEVERRKDVPTLFIRDNKSDFRLNPILLSLSESMEDPTGKSTALWRNAIGVRGGQLGSHIGLVGGDEYALGASDFADGTSADDVNADFDNSTYEHMDKDAASLDDLAFRMAQETSQDPRDAAQFAEVPRTPASYEFARMSEVAAAISDSTLGRTNGRRVFERFVQALNRQCSEVLKDLTDQHEADTELGAALRHPWVRAQFELPRFYGEADRARRMQMRIAHRVARNSKPAGEEKLPEEEQQEVDRYASHDFHSPFECAVADFKYSDPLTREQCHHVLAVDRCSSEVQTLISQLRPVSESHLRALQTLQDQRMQLFSPEQSAILFGWGDLDADSGDVADMTEQSLAQLHRVALAHNQRLESGASQSPEDAAADTASEGKGEFDDEIFREGREVSGLLDEELQAALGDPADVVQKRLQKAQRQQARARAVELVKLTALKRLEVDKTMNERVPSIPFVRAEHPYTLEERVMFHRWAGLFSSVVRTGPAAAALDRWREIGRTDVFPSFVRGENLLKGERMEDALAEELHEEMLAGFAPLPEWLREREPEMAAMEDEHFPAEFREEIMPQIEELVASREREQVARERTRLAEQRYEAARKRQAAAEERVRGEEQSEEVGVGETRAQLQQAMRAVKDQWEELEKEELQALAFNTSTQALMTRKRALQGKYDALQKELADLE